MIFEPGYFTGSSGQRLPWKVNCDGLDANDWYWAAITQCDVFAAKEEENVQERV